MRIILWFLQIQVNSMVDSLMYDRNLSAEKVHNLIFGCFNVTIGTLALFHHTFWLIPLLAYNMMEIYAFSHSKSLTRKFVQKLGFLEELELKQIFQKNEQFLLAVKQSTVCDYKSIQTFNTSQEYYFSFHEDNSIDAQYYYFTPIFTDALSDR